MPGRALMTALACLCVAGLGGCGSDDEPGTIPPENSSHLITLLDAVSDDVASGDCELAIDHADAFMDTVNLLPAEVDDEVKAGLQEAAARLEELSGDPDQCETTTGASGPDGTEAVEPPVETTPTETTDETTDEPTTDTGGEQEEQTEEPPPSGGGEGGQGGGPGEGEVTIEPPPDGDGQTDPDTGGIAPDERPRP